LTLAVEKLRPFLKTLERNCGIKPWDDTQIKPGSKWKDEIKRALEQTKVAVLLVSQAFLASEFITDEELTHFLKASEEDGLTILWVAVSPSTWQQSPIAQFQAANDPQRPLDSFSGSRLRSELVKVAQQILRTVEGAAAAMRNVLPPTSSVNNANPRRGGARSDLPPFVTGAQASFYVRAKTAVRESLPLLQTLVSLDPQGDKQDIATAKQAIEQELNKLIEELGKAGGPSESVVDHCFTSLLGPEQSATGPTEIESNPERVSGTLGLLRDMCSLDSDSCVNTIDDENVYTNFRILVDYITSLYWSWTNNRSFMGLKASSPSLGTQLYFLSLQLSTVSEALQILTSALDTAAIGPAKRRTLMLASATGDAPIFLEDLLSRVRTFATVEGPRLLSAGNRYALTSSFLPEAADLVRSLEMAQSPANKHALPAGYETRSVQFAFDDLHDELNELVHLCVMVGRSVPSAESSAESPG